MTNINRKGALALLLTVLVLCNAIGAGGATKDLLTFEEASTIVLKEVEGTVTKVEMDYKGRTLVYEVEILDNTNREHDFEIDAETGEVLTQHTDRRVKSTTYGKRIRGAKITAEEAIAIAQKESGDATLVSYELDVENGKVYWEVQLYEGRTEYEVIINASTGKVLYVDVDYDD